MPFITVGNLRKQQTIRNLKSGFNRVGKSCGNAIADHNTINHHLDIVFNLLVERRHVFNQVDHAINFHPLKAAFGQCRQLLAVFALAAAHHGGQQVQPRAFRQCHDPVNHLADGLAFNRQAGGRRIGDADTGEQQPQIVINFGDGADGRAWVPRCCLLLD